MPREKRITPQEGYGEAAVILPSFSVRNNIHQNENDAVRHTPLVSVTRSRRENVRIIPVDKLQSVYSALYNLMYFMTFLDIIWMPSYQLYAHFDFSFSCVLVMAWEIVQKI